MYFRPKPVERPEELFDREVELMTFREMVKRSPIVLVVGVRRVGKTSLIKAATYDMRRVYLDLRAFEWRRYVNLDDLLEELARAMTGISRRLAEALSRVEGVSVAGVEVRFAKGRKRPSLFRVLESLNHWGEAEGEDVVIILDEAQELAKLRGANVLPTLAYAYDNLPRLKFVIAGSKVGMLYRFLKVEDADSPFYGRYMSRMELRPLPRHLAEEYLRRGFEAEGVKVGEQIIEKAVEELGGIIGWLAYFGLTAVEYYRAGKRVEEALEEAAERGAELAWSEFCNFVILRGSERYVDIIKVAADGATWSEIKRYLEVKYGVVHDPELARLLKALVDEGFLTREEGQYKVVDPLLRRASKRRVCRLPFTPAASF